MKFRLLVLISFINSYTLLAQDKSVELKANLLTAPLGIINLGVEYPISEKISLEGNGLISPWKSFSGNHLQIYTASLEGRYYFKENHTNFYIGPNIGFGFFDIQKWNYWNTNKFQKGYALFFGGTIGYKKQLNDRWGLDFFVTASNSQGRYHGYEKLEDNTLIRYDSANYFNKSGEWLISKAGIMLTYKLKKRKK